MSKWPPKSTTRKEPVAKRPGDTDGAIIAYLHTHLMFFDQPDAHAQALSKLITLWEKVGKPDRAAQSRQEMQQRYPGFGK